MKSKTNNLQPIFSDGFKERHQAALDRGKERRLNRINRQVEEIQNSEDPLQTAFDFWVPSTGPANTIAGELVRAMMKIVYRDYNDGDMFYDGYGMETCGSAVHYICDMIPELYDEFDDIAMSNLNYDKYTKAIENISNKLITYICNQTGQIYLLKLNHSDYLTRTGESWIEDQGWATDLVLYVEMPPTIYDLLYNGTLEEYELRDFIDSNFSDHYDSFDIAGDLIVFYGLSHNDYEILENEVYSELDIWGDDLMKEFEEYADL